MRTYWSERSQPQASPWPGPAPTARRIVTGVAVARIGVEIGAGGTLLQVGGRGGAIEGQR